MGAPVGHSEARLPMVTDRNSAPFRARDEDAKCPVVQPGWSRAVLRPGVGHISSR